MEKRRRGDGSSGTTTTYNTVFIDTSLDTHLAMIAADSDTVSDLKERIVSEHSQYFPETGEIDIRALKVERRGYYYHLQNSMQVKSAFAGTKKSWFLYADASSLKVHNEMQHLRKPAAASKALLCIENGPQVHDQDCLGDHCFKKPSAVCGSENLKVPNCSNSRPAAFSGEPSKDVAMDGGSNADSQCSDLSLDISRSSLVQKLDNIVEKNRVSEIIPVLSDDKSPVIRNIDYASTGKSLETANSAKEGNASIHASSKGTSHLETVTRKKRKQIKDSIHHHDQAEGSMLYPTQVKDDRRLEQHAEFEKVRAPSEKHDAASVEDVQPPAIDVLQDVPNNNRQDLHEDSLPENYKPKIDPAERIKEARELSQIHDPEVMPTKEHSPLHQDREDKSGESTRPVVSDTKEVMAYSKKNLKKRTKTFRSRFQDELVGHPSNAATDIHSVLIDKSVSNQKSGENTTQQVMDSSEKHVPEKDLSRKLPGEGRTVVSDGDPSLSVDMNEDNNKANDVCSSALNPPLANASLRNDMKPYERVVPHGEADQTEQNNEEGDLVSKNKSEVVTPATCRLPDFDEPKMTRTEQQKMSGSRKKKRARKTATAVCQDASDMKHADINKSPDVPYQQTARRFEDEKDFLSGSEMKEALDASDLVACGEAGKLSGGEGTLCQITPAAKTEDKEEEKDINQYLVPSQHQTEVAMKPRVEAVAEKRIETNVIPSVGNALELQQALLKSCSKQGNEVTSAVKAKNPSKSNKGTKTKKMKKFGDPYATTFSDNEIKTLQKPVASAILNGPCTTKAMPHTKEIDKSLTGSRLSSNSGRSETRPRHRKNDKESSLRNHVVTSKTASSKLGREVVNSSRQEKSLLRTPGAIFKEVSSDTFGDENGSVDSDASTCTPSDNSLSSGYSMEGNDHSENSAGNGTDGVKSKGGSRKRIFNPEFSGPRQIPMDTIIRSSSRFKKAKLSASQQLEDFESQPSEVVPDSLPYQ